MSKTEIRRWRQERELELRGLVWEWDPLGFEGAPADEYDCVVDALSSRLVAHRSPGALLAALD